LIVLIHGNAGVGKSTVAQTLNEKIPDESIVLEVDKLRYNVVDQRIDTDQLDLVDQQVFTATEAFLNSAYEVVIIDGVYQSQNHLYKVVDRLHKIDNEVYVYRLDCSLKENIQRDENRDDELTVGEKVEEVYHEFEQLDHEKEIGEVLNTTNISPDKTAERIHNLIEHDIGKK